MGLVANIAFYNRLNMADLSSWLESGTALDITAIRPDTMMTLSQFKDLAKRLSPIDLLRWLDPGKADRLSETVSDISAVADYGQSLCNHLAASEALEPAHAVLGTLLRTGVNFKAAQLHYPIQLAAQAVAPLCVGVDIDGALSLPKVLSPPNTRMRSTRARPRAPARPQASYPTGVCFDFQRGLCFRTSCKYSHRCAVCRSEAHGQVACPVSSTV